MAIFLDLGDIGADITATAGKRQLRKKKSRTTVFFSWLAGSVYASKSDAIIPKLFQSRRG